MCEDKMVSDDTPVTWGEFAENLAQIAEEMNDVLDRIEKIENNLERFVKHYNELLDGLRGKNETEPKATN